MTKKEKKKKKVQRKHIGIKNLQKKKKNLPESTQSCLLLSRV